MYLIDAQLWELIIAILLVLMIVGFILLAVGSWIMSLMAKHTAKLFAKEFNYDKLAKKIAAEIRKEQVTPVRPAGQSKTPETDENTKA